MTLEYMAALIRARSPPTANCRHRHLRNPGITATLYNTGDRPSAAPPISPPKTWRRRARRPAAPENAEGKLLRLADQRAPRRPQKAACPRRRRRRHRRQRNRNPDSASPRPANAHVERAAAAVGRALPPQIRPPPRAMPVDDSQCGVMRRRTTARSPVAVCPKSRPVALAGDHQHHLGAVGLRPAQENASAGLQPAAWVRPWRSMRAIDGAGDTAADAAAACACRAWRSAGGAFGSGGRGGGRLTRPAPWAASWPRLRRSLLRLVGCRCRRRSAKAPERRHRLRHAASTVRFPRRVWGRRARAGGSRPALLSARASKNRPLPCIAPAIAPAASP